MVAASKVTEQVTQGALSGLPDETLARVRDPQARRNTARRHFPGARRPQGLQLLSSWHLLAHSWRGGTIWTLSPKRSFFPFHPSNRECSKEGEVGKEGQMKLNLYSHIYALPLCRGKVMWYSYTWYFCQWIPAYTKWCLLVQTQAHEWQTQINIRLLMAWYFT